MPETNDTERRIIGAIRADLRSTKARAGIAHRTLRKIAEDARENLADVGFYATLEIDPAEYERVVDLIDRATALLSQV